MIATIDALTMLRSASEFKRWESGALLSEKDVEEQRRECGLPPDALFHRLVVSVPGRAVVAELYLPSDPPAHRLFVRPFDQSRYIEIAAPAGTNSLCEAIASPSEPLLFALGILWQDRGGHPTGVFRIDLKTNSAALVQPARASGSERWWISSILGITNDGSKLVVSRGAPVGEHRGGRMEYSVETFDLSSGTFDNLTTLPCTFM